MAEIEYGRIPETELHDSRLSEAFSLVSATIYHDEHYDQNRFRQDIMGCAALAATEMGSSALVGLSFVRGMDRRPPDEYKAQLSLFAVRPDMQRRGIGRQLLRFTEQFTRRELRRTSLLLHPASDSAAAFYQAHDYSWLQTPAGVFSADTMIASLHGR